MPPKIAGITELDAFDFVKGGMSASEAPTVDLLIGSSNSGSIVRVGSTSNGVLSTAVSTPPISTTSSAAISASGSSATLGSVIDFVGTLRPLADCFATSKPFHHQNATTIQA